MAEGLGENCQKFVEANRHRFLYAVAQQVGRKLDKISLGVHDSYEEAFVEAVDECVEVEGHGVELDYQAFQLQLIASDHSIQASVVEEVSLGSDVTNHPQTVSVGYSTKLDINHENNPYPQNNVTLTTFETHLVVKPEGIFSIPIEFRAHYNAQGEFEGKVSSVSEDPDLILCQRKTKPKKRFEYDPHVRDTKFTRKNGEALFTAVQKIHIADIQMHVCLPVARLLARVQPLPLQDFFG